MDTAGAAARITDVRITDARTNDARTNDAPINNEPVDDAPISAGRVDDVVVPDGLTRRDLDILRFERQWWQFAGVKEQAIRDMFDLSATRYYQVLNEVIDNPAALAAEPLLVRRLRRVRATRAKNRAARRLGIEI